MRIDNGPWYLHTPRTFQDKLLHSRIHRYLHDTINFHETLSRLAFNYTLPVHRRAFSIGIGRNMHSPVIYRHKSEADDVFIYHSKISSTHRSAKKLQKRCNLNYNNYHVVFDGMIFEFYSNRLGVLNFDSSTILKRQGSNPAPPYQLF